VEIRGTAGATKKANTIYLLTKSGIFSSPMRKCGFLAAPADREAQC
jgi:hypothetical protein